MQQEGTGAAQGRPPQPSRRRLVGVLAVVVMLVAAGVVIKVVLAPGPRPPEVITPDSTIPSPEQVLVVDRASRAADDSNPGTAARPLRTVGRALALAAAINRRGSAVRVVIRPGVYRETVGVGPVDGQTEAPISLEGPAKGTAVLSGSDVWTGWARVPRTSLYRHRWPYRWGLAPLPAGWDTARLPDIVRRRELVFVNGRLLRQTLTQAELAKVRGGGYTIDEANGLVVVRLPDALLKKRVNIKKVKIEVATRPLLFRIGGRTNVRVSNLTFQHAASLVQQPAVRVEESSNVQISNSKFIWNNWAGLTLNDDRNISIARSVFDHNGSMGMDAFRVNALTMSHTSNSYNTWRGRWGRWYGWENGMKLSSVHQAVFRNHIATGNQSYGFWLDTDNSDITIQDTRIISNRLAGLFLEASQGPITVDRTVINGNGNRGILVSNAAKTTLTNSQVANNAEAQITLSGDQAGHPVIDWESRQTLNVQSTGWTVRNNRIQAANHQLLVENTWSAASWADARPTYAWTDNTWTSFTDKSFRLLGTNVLGNLREWQTHTGLDIGSTQRRSAS
jgi:hypothetical protein